MENLLKELETKAENHFKMAQKHWDNGNKDDAKYHEGVGQGIEYVIENIKKTLVRNMKIYKLS